MTGKRRPHLRVVTTDPDRKPSVIDAKLWITRVTGARELNWRARTLAAYIGSLFNQGRGFAYPPRDQIVEEVGIDASHVKGLVKELERSGWLSVNRGRGRGNASEFHLNFARSDPRKWSAEKGAATAPFSSSQKGAATAPLSENKRGLPQHEKGGSLVHKRGLPQPPQPSSYEEESARKQPSALQLGKGARERSTLPARSAARQKDPRGRAEGDAALEAGGRARSLEARARPPLGGEPTTNHQPETNPAPAPDEAPAEQTQAEALAEIAAANFDRWNDCPFPGLPAVHPALESEHRTPEDVTRAWAEEISRAAALMGSRARALELYQAAGAERAAAILAKAAASKNPREYAATAHRNARANWARRAKRAATGSSVETTSDAR